MKVRMMINHSRGRLQRTSGKWGGGGGVVLKFRTFPDGGRGGGL